MITLIFDFISDDKRENTSYTTDQSMSSGYFSSSLSYLHDVDKNRHESSRKKDSGIYGTAYPKDGESVTQNNSDLLLTDKERQQESLASQPSRSPSSDIDSSLSPDNRLQTAQIPSTDYNPLQSSSLPIELSSLDSLKRQDTYVVEKSGEPNNEYPQKPPRILKHSSLTVTLSSPPQSPLKKDTDIIENQQIPKVNHEVPIKEDPFETEVVTNLSDLLDDSPNTRKFPRSGFDRSVLYSPFSMPFISVREKNKTPDRNQTDQQQLNANETLEDR